MSHWNPSSSGLEQSQGDRATDRADPGPGYQPDAGYRSDRGYQSDPGHQSDPDRSDPGYQADPGPKAWEQQPWVPPPESAPWAPADPYWQPQMSPAPIWEDPEPPTESAPPMWEDEQPPSAYLRQQPEPPGPGRRTRTVAMTVLVILLLAAGGFALAVKIRSPGGRAAAAPSRNAPANQPQGASAQPSAPVTRAVAGATSRPSPPGSPPLGRATVAVASIAARNPAAASAATFLTSYFTAINGHDYQHFRPLLDRQMRQIETARRFAAGFRTTTDSGAVLIGLWATRGGRLTAIVQFTSHQAPADSPDHLACTRWIITLYLEPSGSGYLLGGPPARYHASRRAC
jgi:hypothetical protein